MDITKIIIPKTSSISIPDGLITSITCEKHTLTKDEYEIINNTLNINESFLNKKLNINIRSNKNNFVGYNTGNSIYTFLGENKLKKSYEYTIDLNISNKNYSFSLKTELVPLYCKPKDVETLISTILKNTREEIDLEYEIFIISQELDETVLKDENLSEEYSQITLKKLAANMTAYNIVYRYYYSFIEELGSNETTVGTLSEKKSKYAVKLDDLLLRFERNIISLEEQLIGIKTATQSFTKAKNTDTGLNSRLW